MAPSTPRVLHVTWRLSSTGGIPVVVRRLCTDLDPDRVEVHVLTVRPPFEEDGLDELGPHVRLHHLGAVGAVPPYRRPALAARAAAVARRVRPDVVHGHSGTAVYALGAALGARRAARVLDVHDAPGRERHAATTERLEGFACRRLGFDPVVHSTSVRDEVAAGWRVPSDRIALVPLGIETGRFVPRIDPGTGPLTVLYVARLAPSKDVDLFLDVAAALRRRTDLPSWRAVVVGTGSELDRLRRRVDDEGLAQVVDLPGERVSDDDLPSVYAGADVFLSTSRYEGFGLAVAEAMASGLPVVSTAVGGVTDLVVDGVTGALVPHGDVAGLAEAVAGLLRDGDARRAAGAAARRRAVERFDVASMVAGYAALYDRLRAAPSSSP